ncbi:hypothetical protein BB561_001670 [Smittium simulii]|uniref:Uncharacterized protein n=1 Tax=Smittium simulii TaxID=133385 RepID=A0A2T9YTN1_9FUNG|nr:hypothetical protein BB561_001670 [Smittium simulii]
MIDDKKVEFYKSIDIKSEVLNISITNGNGVEFGTLFNSSNEVLSKIGTIHDIDAWRFGKRNICASNNVNIFFTPNIPVLEMPNTFKIGTKKIRWYFKRMKKVAKKHKVFNPEYKKKKIK